MSRTYSYRVFAAQTRPQICDKRTRVSLLYIANVNLMNCANPNYMNQWEYKWWCQLCRGVKEKYKDGKDLLGSIFSLDLVNLKNPANPKPMNGGANGGGSSVQVATIRSCSGATARRWTPPALLNLLLEIPRSCKRRLEVEQLRKAKSYTPPALLNLRDLASEKKNCSASKLNNKKILHTY